eukprot:214880-Chlamydomonas_euryale.AAC.7
MPPQQQEARQPQAQQQLHEQQLQLQAQRACRQEGSCQDAAVGMPMATANAHGAVEGASIRDGCGRGGCCGGAGSGGQAAAGAELEIGGVRVDFPFVPYGVQVGRLDRWGCMGVGTQRKAHPHDPTRRACMLEPCCMCMGKCTHVDACND